MDYDDMSDKQKKKFRRAARAGFYTLGAGIGLYFVKFLFPGTENDAIVQKGFGGLSLWLMIYGGLVVLTLLFKRGWTVRVNFVLVWLATPLVLAKLFMDLAAM